MNRQNLGQRLSERQQELIRIGLEEGLFRITESRIFYTHQKKSYKFGVPEEPVRAATYTELAVKYKYPSDRIDFEVYPPRREPKLPADIVVYEDDEKENVFLVVECKPTSNQKDVETACKEGLGNATLFSSEWLLLACGEEEIVYFTGKRPSLKKLEEFRKTGLPIAYVETSEYRYKKGGDVFEEPRRVSSTELSSKFQKCHNLIWEGGKRDPAGAFDEMSKLMFAKIYDEKFTKIGSFYRFQIGSKENHATVAKKINDIYDEVQQKEPGVFKEEIKISDAIVFEIVKSLQDISLTKTDLDAKGRAFEKFLGKVFRGEFGQFFTSREIVDFMVEFIDPDYRELVIDPACGSGGFLLYAIKHIMNKARNEYGETNSKEIIWDFSHRNVFGIEVNSRIARIAMMDMVIHDDGHTNIECNDALEDYDKFDPKESIEPEKYDVLLTNPPFGSRIYQNMKSYFKKYELSKRERGGLKNSEVSEILFLERCIDLLKPGGRLGIILPDSAFTNKGNIQVVKYILQKVRIMAIISLPQHSFEPFGSMAKTSILFLEKKNNIFINEYPIFMAYVEKIGYNSTWRPERNDLSIVLDEWSKFRRNPFEYPIHKGVSEDLWFTKVSSLQLENKLDVEAYCKDYMDILDKISELEKKDDFSMKKLECVSKIFPGIGPQKKDYVENPGLPVVKTASVTKVKNRFGIIDWNKISFVEGDSYKKSRKALELNDILVQSVAHNKAYIGDKVAILADIPEKYGRVLALSKFNIIRPDERRINPYYLYIYLSSEFGQIQLRHYVRGMTAQIYEFDIRNLQIILPPRKVQDDIAERFVSTLDEVLQIEENLEEKKKDLEKIMRMLDT